MTAEPDEQERSKVRVRQFMNVLEQLPRLCSPTICGTLSQPTTRTERLSCGADVFEWSLEQRAILSPANITDTDGTDHDWHNVVSELAPGWRQQESEMFFSQRTIAPSPLTTPSMRRPINAANKKQILKQLILDEEDEDEILELEEEDNSTRNADNRPQDNDTDCDYEQETHDDDDLFPEVQHEQDDHQMAISSTPLTQGDKEKKDFMARFDLLDFEDDMFN